jgi:hypothetical protein
MEKGEHVAKQNCLPLSSFSLKSYKQRRVKVQDQSRQKCDTLSEKQTEAKKAGGEGEAWLRR